MRRSCQLHSPMEIGRDEYQSRISAMQQQMAAREIDAALFTDQANVIYFTGYETEHVFVTRSRLVALVVPVSGNPHVIAPRSHVYDVSEQTGLEASPYDGLRHAPVEEIAATLLRNGDRIGLEFGLEQRVDMTVQDLDRLRSLLPHVIDISEAVWQLRTVKSPGELALIERACRIADEALQRAISSVRRGDTECGVADRIAAEVARLGGRVAFLIMTSGAGSYYRSNGTPRNRPLKEGDFVFIDLGVRYRGYHSDFNRNVVVGRPTREQQALQQSIKEVTEQAARYLVPGNTVADVCNQVLADCRSADLDIRAPGRIGHGLGLDVTEPPHMSAEDTTLLASGVVTTIEPMLEREDALYCAEIIYAVTPGGGRPLNDASSLLGASVVAV